MDGEAVVVPEPVVLVEAAAPAGLLVAGRGPVVAPGPTVVSRDPVVPEASTGARPDPPVAGAAVPLAAWVVPPWLVPSDDLVVLEQQVSTALVVLEPLALTVLEGLAQRV